MLEGFTIRKNDAAACLAAALLSRIYHHFYDEDGITRSFIVELCNMLSDEKTSQIDILNELVNAAEDSVFMVVHWLYGKIESRDLSEAQIFCLLGKYGAKKDADGSLQLTLPGDGPGFFSTVME